MKIKKLNNLIKRTHGSFTIEATIIFPLIFLITLVLIWCSIFVYQQASLLYGALTTAERTAAHWDNSYKHPVSGLAGIDENDGLYWRLFNDRITDMFGFHLFTQPVSMNIFDANEKVEERGLRRKLQRAAIPFGSSIRGTVTYVNQVFDRRVEVILEHPFSSPAYASTVLGDSVHADAVSWIVEPVEFIRTTDLVYTYASQLMDRQVTKPEAKRALDEFLGRQAPDAFNYHIEAHTYLKSLVGGVERSLATSTGVRMIDAFDQQGIAHQAFLTFTENQLRTVQMVKDVELLQQGDVVKGVVWHFFRRTNQTGRVGPSDAFRKELEKKGIVVVIHD